MTQEMNKEMELESFEAYVKNIITDSTLWDNAEKLIARHISYMTYKNLAWNVLANIAPKATCNMVAAIYRERYAA